MISRRASARRQCGFSLIDVMVGIVIALIAVLIIYQVFDVAEGIKRNVTGGSDAQQNGLLSTFMMVLQGSNAGANLAVSGQDLDVCPTGDGSSTSDIKATLRPVPVIISDSGDDATSDTFVVNYGSAERVVTPVNFSTTPTNFGLASDFTVQSPLGFQKGDVVVVINGSGASTGLGKCAWTTVTDDPGTPDAGGFVTIKHGAVVATPDDGTDYPSSSMLLDLGQAPRRIQYSVDGNGTLHSLELFNVSDDVAPVPIANNIVLMKVQYGIADPATGFLQKWVKATSDGTDDWRASAMLTKSYVELSRVKAIRIALIVRSEAYDKCAYADTCPDPTTNAFSYSLFSQCDSIPCPDPITGTIDPTPGNGNFRYRVYETIVPLRNAVWNLHTVS